MAQWVTVLILQAGVVDYNIGGRTSVRSVISVVSLSLFSSQALVLYDGRYVACVTDSVINPLKTKRRLLYLKAPVRTAQ